jgi:hypothetical protein
MVGSGVKNGGRIGSVVGDGIFAVLAREASLQGKSWDGTSTCLDAWGRYFMSATVR